MDIFTEDFSAQDRFQEVNSIFHAESSFGIMEHSKKYAGINKFKGLQERPGGLIVVDRIHLCDKYMRVLKNVGGVILISSSLKVSIVSSFLIVVRFLSGNFAGDLASQVESG